MKHSSWLSKFVPLFIASIFILTLIALAGYVYVGARIFSTLDGCKPTVTVESTDTGQQYSVGCGK